MKRGYLWVNALLTIALVTESFFLINITGENSQLVKDNTQQSTRLEELKDNYQKLSKRHGEVQAKLSAKEFWDDVDKNVQERQSGGNKLKRVPKVSLKEKEIPKKKTVWLNTNSGVWHNSSCRYYGDTKSGKFTTEPWGRACQICGG
jgi:hypothetical protein